LIPYSPPMPLPAFAIRVPCALISMGRRCPPFDRHVEAVPTPSGLFAPSAAFHPSVLVIEQHSVCCRASCGRLIFFLRDFRTEVIPVAFFPFGQPFRFPPLPADSHSWPPAGFAQMGRPGHLPSRSPNDPPIPVSCPFFKNPPPITRLIMSNALPESRTVFMGISPNTPMIV